MATTAIYPNRVADKEKLEAALRLAELGNATTRFHTSNGTLFAQGYNRIVYGDHGPYVEFDQSHIQTTLRNKFPTTPKDAFYIWMVPTDGSQLKVYHQLRTVEHLKNPPAGGFRGGREEGYADYKVGYIYVNPYDFGKIDTIPTSERRGPPERPYIQSPRENLASFSSDQH
jgi:hypothetical protein